MMMNTLFWNVRSVRSQNSFHRIQMLHRHHNLSIIALMAPFQRTDNIQRYKRRLGMEYANHNCKGKIWVFIYDQFQVEVLSDSEQMLTLSLKFLENNQLFAVSMVYAKCDAEERLNLWNDIYCICNDINNSPWLTGEILMSL